jgi:5-methylcytosine-specific restriction endonuclease McrA
VIQGVSPRKRCGSCTAQVARDKAREYYAKKKRKEPAVRIAECEWCAGEYPQTNHQQKYCTPRCGKTARGARSDRVRAAYHGVEYQPINRHRIYTRDDWTCGICGDRIDPGAKWPDLMCASLDHIVPMAEGGGHVLSNVQAAHFLCNSYKGASDLTLLIA